MRVLILDPIITKLERIPGFVWHLPLAGKRDRLIARAQGQIALIASGKQSLPDAIVLPRDFPEEPERPDMLKELASYAGLRLAHQIRQIGITMPLILVLPPTGDVSRIDEVALEPIFTLEDPWHPEDTRVRSILASIQSVSAESRVQDWPGVMRDDTSPDMADGIAFLAEIVEQLDRLPEIEQFLSHLRETIGQLEREAECIPGAEIVIGPMVEALTRPMSSPVALGAATYGDRFELYHWAAQFETASVVFDLITHDIRSQVTAMASLLCLADPLPEWGISGGVGTHSAAIQSFSKQVRSINRQLANNELELIQALGQLRKEFAGRRDLRWELEASVRPSPARRLQQHDYQWILTVYKAEDPWHGHLKAAISRLSHARGSLRFEQAHSRSEAAEKLRLLLTPSAENPVKTRPEPGLVFVGDDLPDGPGLDFLEMIMHQALTDNSDIDWWQATYVYCSATSSARERVEASEYADLIRVMLKHADSMALRKQLERIVATPPGWVQPGRHIRVMSWTRQPLAIGRGARGVPSLSSNRRLSLLEVSGQSVFVTPWQLEIVNALVPGRKASSREIAERVFHQYYYEQDQFYDEAELPVPPDDLDDIAHFCKWFIEPSDQSRLKVQIRNLNQRVAKALIEQARGAAREPIESFPAPVLIEPADDRGRWILTGRVEEIKKPSRRHQTPSQDQRYVVVIDDEPYWCGRMSRTVAEMIGIEPVILQSTEEARSWLDAGHTIGAKDVILLDISFPTSRFEGFELYAELIQREDAPQIAIVTSLSRDVVFNRLPHCHSPSWYALPPDLSASEMVRRTRPPELFKMDALFDERLREFIAAAWMAQNHTENPITHHLEMPLIDWSDELTVVVRDLGGSIVRTVSRVSKKQWALAKVMAGRYPGIWLTDHYIENEVRQILMDWNGTRWNFAQEPGIRATPSNLRGVLSDKNLRVFEAVAPGSGLYRMRADIITPSGSEHLSTTVD